MSLTTSLKILNKMFPDAHCELVYNTPFQLLVSVVLSAQTTDVQVNKTMKPLYDRGFTPEYVVRLGQKRLLTKIKSIGLAPTKSKNVVRLSQIIMHDFDGEIPRSREDLESLPGVGRKTANVVLAEIYHEPTLAVDTHVYRVTKRLGFHSESTPLKSEAVLLKKIPKSYLPLVHHQFIFLGRRLCKARNPECGSCQLAKKCVYFKEEFLGV